MPDAVKGWHRLSNLCRCKLNHHGCLGPPPFMSFLVGAVREPLLRVHFSRRHTAAGIYCPPPNPLVYGPLAFGPCQSRQNLLS